MDNIVYLVKVVLISFFVSMVLGPMFIPLLHKLKFGQSIREEGPESHKKKAGTPTIGGIIFILSSVITMTILRVRPSDEAMMALYSFIAFGLIGFIDDALKVLHKKNLGLKAYQKMLMIVITSSIFAFYAASNSSIGTSIMMPFTNLIWNLGVWYIPFIIFYFASVTNAVNLTDGLDGLATSVTLLIMTFFGLVSFSMGHITLAVFCAALAGALLGFLRYNAYPARVFMGDTGSLALGGAVASVAMILKLPLLVVIVGGIYVAEALSVVIQVASFKLTGKRVFKMSPLHHHFELSGWHETKIVSIFSIITVVLCLLGFLSFK